MFQRIKNTVKSIIGQKEEVKLTPKGISFLQYLQNDVNGVEQDKIEAYEELIKRLENAIEKSERRKEELNSKEV